MISLDDFNMALSVNEAVEFMDLHILNRFKDTIQERYTEKCKELANNYINCKPTEHAETHVKRYVHLLEVITNQITKLEAANPDCYALTA
jgi:phage anti-repressor protein